MPSPFHVWTQHNDSIFFIIYVNAISVVTQINTGWVLLSWLQFCDIQTQVLFCFNLQKIQFSFNVVKTNCHQISFSKTKTFWHRIYCFIRVAPDVPVMRNHVWTMTNLLIVELVLFRNNLLPNADTYTNPAYNFADFKG